MLRTQKKITAKEVMIRLLIIVSVCEKFLVLFFVWTLGHCENLKLHFQHRRTLHV